MENIISNKERVKVMYVFDQFAHKLGPTGLKKWFEEYISSDDPDL